MKRLEPILGVGLWLLVATESFVVLPSPSWGQDHHNRIFMTDQNEPDLFEYFDPLLSPHAYPNGISPDRKTLSQKGTVSGSSEGSMDQVVPTFDFSSQIAISIVDNRQQEPVRSSTIDPDFFDPLLSPHMYPNGTPEKLLVDIDSATTGSAVPSDTFEPFDVADFVSLLPSISAIDTKPTLPFQQQDQPRQDTVSPDVFDPLLSPHMYPNGTPNRLVGDKKKRVGVLLMDHGSRNQGSNDRLHELARIYQESVDGDQFVVAAAHMELASPSIPEGLQTLMERGVDEIICHPYFLSAQGRHVSEDIPEIINGAIEALGIEIPIVTTPPVGSQTDIMIGAVQSLVLQHSNALKSRG